jgi:hypothetical protein
MKNSPESREIPCNQTQNTAWVPGIRVCVKAGYIKHIALDLGSIIQLRFELVCRGFSFLGLLFNHELLREVLAPVASKLV